MHLDRAHRDEQRLRDLGVREALGGESRDAALARRERVDAAAHHAARTGPGGTELGARASRRARSRRRPPRARALEQRLTRGRALAARRSAAPCSTSACASSSGARERRVSIASSRVSTSSPTSPSTRRAAPMWSGDPNAAPRRDRPARAGSLRRGRRCRATRSPPAHATTRPRDARVPASCSTGAISTSASAWR